MVWPAVFHGRDIEQPIIPKSPIQNTNYPSHAAFPYQYLHN